VGYVLNIISKKQIAPLVESVAVAVTSEKIELPMMEKRHNSAFLVSFYCFRKYWYQISVWRNLKKF
jgi:hypothetical protein